MNDNPRPEMGSEISRLVAAIRLFALERDWEQFNSPKNLACSLSIEAAEILEHFQWLTDQQSRELPAAKIDAVALEAADVFLYLLNLIDKLGIDLVDATHRKLAINAQKYPVELARGTARKYTDL
jgi:NTP pyrophosphatase (non-canonical NTP hydrolase)